MKEKKVDKYITAALFELLKSKELIDITTTEIITKAGVCRSSFYRNFYLLEDVIRQYGNEMFEEIDQQLPIGRDGLREHIKCVNEFFLSQRERLILLDKRNLFYLLEEPIYTHCARQIRRLGVLNRQYQIEFYAGATFYLIRAWIHNGFRETPEEIARTVCDFIKWDFS